MDTAARAALLDDLAAAGAPLARLAGLTRRDVDALAQLAAASFQGKRCDAAARLYGALAALQPDEPLHLLHLAYAEAGAGRVEAACAAVQRLLDVDAARDAGDLARALLLRATLLRRLDPAAAAGDVRAARLLARTSPAAHAVLQGGA